MQQFIGEIRLLSYNSAPLGWAVCNGALLPINQNVALFFPRGEIEYVSAGSSRKQS
jgi:microcystin-dependent protein